MLNVFLSSTTRDLDRYRDEARQWIRTFQLHDIAMERWNASPDPPSTVVREALQESHIFVGILAWRYGSTVPESDVSYVEYEHRLARELGLRRLVFLADEDGEWPVKHIDRDATRIWNFRAALQSGGGITRKTFRNLDEFRLSLSGSLVDTIRQTPGYAGLSREQKAAIRIAGLLRADLAFRESADDRAKASRQWFVPPMRRCNLGAQYIEREDTSGRFASWLLRRPTPYLVLTGPSGVGKTNFLVAQIEHIIREPHPSLQESQRVLLYLPLGSHYTAGEGLSDTLARYFLANGGGPDPITADTFRSLIRSGRALLILDGLDEMVRNQGEEACAHLVRALKAEVDPDHSTVVMGCRDHIYSRLVAKGLVPGEATPVEVPPLDAESIEVALRTRFTATARLVLDRVPTLKGFASHPLLLEMMARIDTRSWQRLAQEPRRARLYELWTDEVMLHAAGGANLLGPNPNELIRGKLGRIATLMLRSRSDLVNAAELLAEGLPLDTLASAESGSFSILVRQTREEWGFLHDSFREYALARLVADDLESNEHTHLASLEDLDYVGAETYCFLDEMFADRKVLLDRLRVALSTPLPDAQKRNNLLRNCFEAIGMVGERTAEPFIPVALDLLAPDRRGDLLPRTQHNIIRCVERLHRSAPQPYFQHVIQQGWPKHPTPDCFGAAAVRGFHQRERSVGYSHPMMHRGGPNDGSNPYQQEVSACLLDLLGGASLHSDDARELMANGTFALIRWLHPRDLEALKNLLRAGRLEPMARGNAFLALLRFENPEVLAGTSELFAGMELSRVSLDHHQVPADFRFLSATFHRCRQYLHLPEAAFSGCTFTEES